MNNDEVLTVAIDGPSASGKSTVSRQVAKRLGFVYIDSGSLYRGVTWKALRSGVSVKDGPAVTEMVLKAAWDFFLEERSVSFTIDGDYPGQDLRSEPVRENVADIAAIADVRSFIVTRLREMTHFGSLVVEGRDIGSVVFPESPYKFYIDADPEERARRRCEELIQTEGQGDVGDVLNSLQRRDKKDSSRKTAPLQIALGAIVINTTRMSIEEVVDEVVRIMTAAGAQPHG